MDNCFLILKFDFCSARCLMVIAICEMKEEDAESQIIFWESLNEVMVDNGHPMADFAGFMADEAGANWVAIRTIFNGGPENVLVGRERSCLFHWEQSLHKHTKKLVPAETRTHHVEMCEQWRLCKFQRDATQQANHIREWWLEKMLPKENVDALNKWFTWWEKRIEHWGSLSTNVSFL